MYAKVVVVLYCLQIPRYFVVEDVIWDAATTVIMIMITVRISYSSLLLSTSILPRYTYILFVGGMNLTSLSLSFCYCWFSRPILGKILVVMPF